MKWLRRWGMLEIISLLLLLLLLCVADVWCYAFTLPVEVDLRNGSGIVQVGSATLALGQIGAASELQFAPRDPVIHEYQLDGSDSSNNFTLDEHYLRQIESWPYYRFQAWMRNLDGSSSWRDLEIQAHGTEVAHAASPANGEQVMLPAASTLRIRLQLQRPETPVTLNLFMQNGSILRIVIDRNDRYIAVTRHIPGQGTTFPLAKAFFPTDVAPFAAMVADTVLRSAIWAIVVLLAVLCAEATIGIVQGRLASKGPERFATPVNNGSEGGAVTPELVTGRVRNVVAALAAARGGAVAPELVTGRRDDQTAVSAINLSLRGLPGRLNSELVRRRWRLVGGWLTKSLHPVALLALLASLGFVSWIALVQFNAEPHIFDASAYLFAAKMYALGHLWVPVPAAIDRFPGPFMVAYQGRWFAQYPPGTALTLAPGLWLGVPWLVEPLLGALALLGSGLIAARLYDRRVATLVVMLGTLSPFYSYLAASYLSHTIALFYLVWGLWSLLRFAQGESRWNMLLSAALFGMAGLTRDLDAVLFTAIMVVGMALLSWGRIHQQWRRWLAGGALFLLVAGFFAALSFGFDALLTGSPWITPRSLFFPGDHWGFGQGVGFYGQHTLAAGLVNLDELLTLLAIDLYGWPFYLTFAFLLLPFLTRRAKGPDCFCLCAAAILAAAYVGYFYHGIYLGPRYLYETLPFLLILTARGILTLASVGAHARTWWRQSSALAVESARLADAPTRRLSSASSISVITGVIVAALLACNLLYFWPRQIELHADFTGMPVGYQIDLPAVYHPPLRHAIVVTSDYTLYSFVLFPLNDPYLRANVIYAMGTTRADYLELQQAFPGRALYRIDIKANGAVTYTPVAGSSARFMAPFCAACGRRAAGGTT